jgi:hypothetical protein
MFWPYAFWPLYVLPPTPRTGIGAMETTATHPHTAADLPHIRRLPSPFRLRYGEIDLAGFGHVPRLPSIPNR